MPGKVADIILVIALLALPLLGIIQACGGNGPVSPGPPVNDPENGDGNGDQINDGLGGPVLSGGNHAPTAILSVVGPEEGATPFTVQLDGSGSFDPDGDPLEYLWIFSDGGSATESIAEHEFVSSGRYNVTLVVTDPHDASDDEGPLTLYSWGLANSPWPKFAHDVRNSGVAHFEGPMMDLENADSGGAWHRYWRSGNEDDIVCGICIGYDGMVVYTQGEWLRVRTADGSYLWDFEAESPISAWPAIAHDGSVIIGTDAGWVYRFDPEGNLMWSTNFDAEIGRGLHLWSAVNIHNNGSIFVGGIHYISEPVRTSVGKLIALSIDGNLLWWRDIESYFIRSSLDYPLDTSRIIPAITPSGDIVINGEYSRIFSPDGTLITELELFQTDYNGTIYKQKAGPPSVNTEGGIVLGTYNCPFFLPSGTYHIDLFEEICQMLDIFISPGELQAPVWSSNGVTMIQTTYEVDYASYSDLDIYLTTRTTNGRSASVNLGVIPFVENKRYLRNLARAGATEDANGRIYASCTCLYAVSPVTFDPLFPYGPNRYSLWSYKKEGAYFMTPPVIGDDRWLYVGYGSDILAVGD